MPTLPQQPPHSFEAESAVIGGLILAGEKSEILAECVTTGIVAEEFWHAPFRETYRAIVDMASTGTPIDLITLKNELTNRRVFSETFTIEHLASAVETVPTASNTAHYAKIIRQRAAQRHVFRLSQSIAEKVSKGVELNGELDSLIEFSKKIDAQKSQELSSPKPASVVLEKVEDDVKFVLEPILAEGCLTQLQGDPKAGKSCLAELIALSCALGRWVSGRWNFHGEPRKVLYLSYEDNLRRIKHRAKQYLPSLGSQAFPTSFMLVDNNPQIDMTTDAGRKILETYLGRDGIQVLIIDTLSYIHTAEENSMKEMGPVMANLRQLLKKFPHCCILLVHHTNKGGNQDSSSSIAKKGRGSSAIAAAYDIILDFGNRIHTNTTACALASKEKPGSDEFSVIYKPQDDGTVSWSLEDEYERPDMVAKLDRIVSAIGELEKTSPTGVFFSTIHASLPDIAKKTLVNNLKTLVEGGKIEEMKAVGPRNANGYRVKR